jgi:hypothetical protein
MIEILSCIIVNQEKKFLNIAPPSEGTILQIQKNRCNFNYMHHKRCHQVKYKALTQSTTQFKLHKNMDEDTWTCTSSLSMCLHIRFFLCIDKEQEKTEDKVNTIQINYWLIMLAEMVASAPNSQVCTTSSPKHLHSTI